MKEISSSFVLTKKNIQVENFFDEHGFNIKTNDAFQKQYICDIDKINIFSPEHIKLT